MANKIDTKYMRLALGLAAKAKDKTYPNPMVGAVIVKGGKVIGKGYHRRAGEDHAEVAAMKDAGDCSGGVMYVTLEPCDHFGRTPPCTQALINSGIKAVYVAMKDPNPLNSGRGIRKLRRSGIRVNVGLCAEEAFSLNRKYVKFVTTDLPYVTLKLAQSVDGKIAAGDGTSKWITSGSSRGYARKLRSGFDAVMVGANTVLKDDPLLLGEGRSVKKLTRIVVDTRLRIPVDSKLVKTAVRSPVIIATTELAPKSKAKKLSKAGGIEIMMTRSRRGRVALKPFFKKLVQKGIVNVMVEGGGELAGSLVDENMVDEVMFFIAPKILGGAFSSVKGRGVKNIASAIELNGVEVKRIGTDILVRGVACSRG
ncbi:MAG: bifunctional diaminohydroxyphosphoribosylaminopyrimidine deaminase/5-amino-6-(5-phosphoribosylamino)uracil reductase RibD [Candidatus Omnitrophota bacterium]